MLLELTSSNASVDKGDFFQTTERLEKVIQGGLKRNLHREDLPWESFDASTLDDDVKGALAFLVAQLTHFEAISPQNLSLLSASTPVQSLRNAYATQVHDEVAHGNMLLRYQTQCLGASPAVHASTKLAAKSGLLVQLDPLAGSVGVMAGIEFFAVEVLGALKEKVQEPLLLSMIAHIEKDEHRHKAIAVESARVLSQTSLTKGVVGVAKHKALRKCVELFFRHVTCPTFHKRVAPLELVPKELYEKSLDEMSDTFRRELGSDGRWTGVV